MKKEKIPELKIKAFRLIPMSQAKLYKKLKLSSQDGSQLVKIMLNEKLLKRRKIIEDNRVTYMLTRSSPDRLAESFEPKRFQPLIRGNVFSPCTGCPQPVCEPVKCTELTEWIFLA